MDFRKTSWIFVKFHGFFVKVHGVFVKVHGDFVKVGGGFAKVQSFWAMGDFANLRKTQTLPQMYPARRTVQGGGRTPRKISWNLS